MFEVGFTEIVLIFGIALLVLGPARLPKLAADLGRWAGRARAMARTLRTQLEQEVQFDPLASNRSPAAGSQTIHTPQPAAAPPADERDRAEAALPTEATPGATDDADPVTPPVSAGTPGPAYLSPDTTTVPDERKPG
jgi:sec-independent protein translocase protein TatB